MKEKLQGSHNFEGTPYFATKPMDMFTNAGFLLGDRSQIHTFPLSDSLFLANLCARGKLHAHTFGKYRLRKNKARRIQKPLGAIWGSAHVVFFATQLKQHMYRC